MSGCKACDLAVEVEQLGVIKVDDAEVGIAACDEHLRRLCLALERLGTVEMVTRTRIPPLIDLAVEDRVVVWPGHRS